MYDLYVEETLQLNIIAWCSTKKKSYLLMYQERREVYFKYQHERKTITFLSLSLFYNLVLTNMDGEIYNVTYKVKKILHYNVLQTTSKDLKHVHTDAELQPSTSSVKFGLKRGEWQLDPIL